MRVVAAVDRTMGAAAEDLARAYETEAQDAKVDAEFARTEAPPGGGSVSRFRNIPLPEVGRRFEAKPRADRSSRSKMSCAVHQGPRSIWDTAPLALPLVAPRPITKYINSLRSSPPGNCRRNGRVGGGTADTLPLALSCNMRGGCGTPRGMERRCRAQPPQPRCVRSGGRPCRKTRRSSAHSPSCEIRWSLVLDSHECEVFSRPETTELDFPMSCVASNASRIVPCPRRPLTSGSMCATRDGSEGRVRPRRS